MNPNREETLSADQVWGRACGGAEQQESVRRQVALKIIKLGMDTRQVVRGSRLNAKPWR
jgi:hypothetical protein